MTTKLIFLEVPYAEKEKAKALGARWNANEKKWFIFSNQDQEPFEQWLPAASSEPTILAFAPIYLLRYDDACWCCGAVTPLFCLASHGFQEEDWHTDQFVHYAFLRYIPDNLHPFFKEHLPNYFLDHTQQSNSVYYVNHCSCGAKFGDFYIHNEPESAFVPMSPMQAKSIQRCTLSEDENLPLDADYCSSEPEFILPHSTKVEFLDIIKR